MTNLEHYFENLLYHGEDIKGEANKNALTEEQQKSVEQCAQYVIYSLFGTREHFNEWIKRDAAPRWVRCEDAKPKERDYYFAFTADAEAFVGEYISSVDQWWNGDDLILTVTHWMPIEPPKEDA